MIGYLVVDAAYSSDDRVMASVHKLKTLQHFRSIAVDGTTVHLCKNAQRNNYLCEDPEFLLSATGTFIYDDRRGNDALHILLGRLREDADVGSHYQHFHGPYTLLIVDKRRSRLCIITDREGLQHCFISERAGAQACSSSQLLLAAISDSALDPEAIREFIHLGTCMQRRTLFRDVERQAAATALTRERGQWRSRRLWRIQVASPHLADAYPEIVAKSSAMLEAATRVAARVEPGRLVADVTAGTDSRTILSFLLRAQPRLTVSAVGASDHVDVIRSKEIASRLGLSHYWNEQKEHPPLTAEAIDEAVELADGTFNPFDILLRLEYFREMAARFDISFGGNGGPLFKDHYWLYEFNRTGLSAEPNWERITKFSIISYTPQDDFMVGFDQTILESVRDMLAAHSQNVIGMNNQKLDYVYFDFKCPPMTGSVVSLCNKFYDVYHPLLEGDIVQYMVNIDPSVRKYNILQFSMIYRNDRRLAWIPTDNGMPAVPPVGRFLPLRALVLRRYARSAYRKLNSFVLKRSVRLEARSVNPVAESLWAAGYLDLLDHDAMAIARMISRERLRAMRDRPGTGSNSTYLMHTLAVELFVKRVAELAGRPVEKL